MKTAISLPDEDFERFEAIAARNGMSRSEFYRRAAARFAEELDETSRLTAIADAAIDRAGQPVDEVFLQAVQRTWEKEAEW